MISLLYNWTLVNLAIFQEKNCLREGKKVFVLFKKRIAVDPSNEEISRVTTILDQNNINYELLTKRTRGVYG